MNRQRSWILVSIVALLLGLATRAFMQSLPGGRPLASILPSDPLLVLEAENFGGLLADWNNSPEKQQWLDSANYRMFSRSRLFYRLEEARTEFAAAAGFSADMSLVESVAGTASALALYDIGELRFLYVSRLGSARALENALWQSRANFEPRNSAGQQYYIRTDTESGRQAVFAATDEYLLLATAEEPLAQALALLAGQGGQPVTNDAWYNDAAQAATSRGELRLTLNMQTVTRTPYFRSYWVQQNISELQQYRAGIIDLHRGSGELREERTFLRSEDAPARPAGENRGQALEQVLRLTLPNAFYRAWAEPRAADVVDLLRQKLLDPTVGPVNQPDYAPRVSMGDGVVGSQAALETRIDEAPPVVASGTFSPQPLEALFARNAVAAMLQTESSRPGVEGVFVNSNTAITLLGASEWDFAAVLESLASSIEGRLTVSEIGAEWTGQPIGGQTAYRLSGVAPLLASGQGRYLVIANSSPALAAVLARMSEPATQTDTPSPATFAAWLRPDRERANYTKLMTHLDFLQGGQMYGNQQREPYFFSESLASLFETLSRVESVSRRVDDHGETVSETVVYQISQ